MHVAGTCATSTEETRVGSEQHTALVLDLIVLVSSGPSNLDDFALRVTESSGLKVYVHTVSRVVCKSLSQFCVRGFLGSHLFLLYTCSQTLCDLFGVFLVKGADNTSEIGRAHV